MKFYHHSLSTFVLIVILAFIHALVSAKAEQSPSHGERIVILGNGLAERMLYYGHFETELHLRYPEHELVIRNMARPGDTAGFRPHPSRASQWAFPGAEKFHPTLQQHLGEGFFPTPDQWLERERPDTILAFFGYNESFEGSQRVENFSGEIEAFVLHTLSQRYNGVSTPRLVLVSPIAFEDLSHERDLPNGVMENENLALYTDALRGVAQKHQLTFIDLFAPTLELYKERQNNFTINGFAPTDHGYRALAKLLADGMYTSLDRTSQADPELLRKMVLDKDWFWFNDFQVPNGVHVYGRRYAPHGDANYPDELEKTRDMTLLREKRIHEIAKGKTQDLIVDDSSTHRLPEIESNVDQPIEYLDRARALDQFTMWQGFAIDLFASEAEFPDLRNPVQLSFDNRGRLWVAVMTSYPHYKPGDARPNDKLLILEDTDGDGRADTQKVFAEGLHLPIGFELAPEGVYVSQEPNLCLLVDDNNDDRADRMEILLHGFDSHDTHHAISAFCADASGAFYMCEGRFLHSQVETPYGPERCNDGGVWRFDPKSYRLERFSQTDYNNPWGVAFDEWDQCFISDASGGNNWWALPLSAKMPYGVEIPKVPEFAPMRARPTSGSEFISTRHFPEELQGHFMLCNTIGFLGTSLHDVWEDGAGFSGKHVGDLLSSQDPNFRPVDIELAPDGSLYVVDWHNALIGHWPHNMRDPKRDREHGRIYRVTYPSRPLIEPAHIAGASIPQLLENLKLPEYRTRYRTRRELRAHPKSALLPAIQEWITSLDSTDEKFEHHLCEALWATWAQNEVDVNLLRRLLSAESHQARAAATHVLRYTYREIPDSTELFLKAANDPHGRVRLEAIVAASWLDNTVGVQIALEALRHPLDTWMAPVFEIIMKETLSDDLQTLKDADQLSLTDNPAARDFLSGTLHIPIPELESAEVTPTRELGEDEKAVYELGREVFHRDAHCATCHQSDGRGVAGIYPPLTESEWVRGDEERLIKLTLKGLWGPIEVGDQHYDPKNGVPPMTGFGAILSAEEIAAVLSYVRTSFGNSANFVQPDTVRAVRDATQDRANFYMADDLLREHPFE